MMSIVSTWCRDSSFNNPCNWVKKFVFVKILIPFKKTATTVDGSVKEWLSEEEMLLAERWRVVY